MAVKIIGKKSGASKPAPAKSKPAQTSHKPRREEEEEGPLAEVNDAGEIEVGSLVTWEDDGETHNGEVKSIDTDENEAKVVDAESGKKVIVSCDDLTLAESAESEEPEAEGDEGGSDSPNDLLVSNILRAVAKALKKGGGDADLAKAFTSVANELDGE